MKGVARPLLLLALAAALAAGIVALSARSTHDDGPPPDPFAFDPPVSSPRGAAFSVVERVGSGDEFEGRGAFGYRRRVVGKVAGDAAIPDLDVDGTFTATRRVVAGPKGKLRSTVEGRLTAKVTEGAKPARVVEGTMSLAFDHGVAGGTSAPGTKAQITAELQDAAEGLAMIWTGRVPLPPRPVHVGEAFEPKEVVDLDPMKRKAFRLFMYRNAIDGIMVPQGDAWVDGLRGKGPDEEATVKTLLRLMQTGNSAVPGDPALETDWLEVVRATHRVRLSDGTARSVEWSSSSRLRRVAAAVDYTVRTDVSARIEESRAP